jgi:hypothetical protein
MNSSSEIEMSSYEDPKRTEVLHHNIAFSLCISWGETSLDLLERKL